MKDMLINATIRSLSLSLFQYLVMQMFFLSSLFPFSEPQSYLYLGKLRATM